MGKISGAVGAYNAQVGLGIKKKCGRISFEKRVLAKLGLRPSPISTQIIPPDPLAYFLCSMCLTSGVLAQFGRDCRQLMRTEIWEVIQPKKKEEVSSSTMADKNNPTIFENTDGRYISQVGEFLKVLMAFISEHQRDLMNSSVMREYPLLLINLQHQLNTLLQPDKETGVPFISRIIINEEALRRNLEMRGDSILAEPMYIAVQMGGYTGDAHALVSDVLAPRAKQNDTSLLEELMAETKVDAELLSAVDQIPEEVWKLFQNPSNYIGDAEVKALEIVKIARRAADKLEAA